MRRPLLVLAVVVVAACGTGDDVADERSQQVRDAAAEAGLDVEVTDFLALAARGTIATYQATYPGPEEGTSVVVANRTPDRRVDIIADEEIIQVGLSLDGEAFTCTRDADADAIVSCERTDAIVEAPGAFAPSAIESLTTALTDRAQDFDFSLETSPIAGVEARCLVTNVRAGRESADLADGGTICVSPEGVLLRVAQGDEVLEATDYTTDIPDNTFVRPDLEPGK